MSKTIIKTFLFFGIIFSQACEQQLETINYKDEKFSLNYPASWQMTNEKGILNFFPKENYGAVTVSSYSGINFPLEKTKDFIIEMSQVNDRPEMVKMETKQNQVEFYYESADKDGNWVTTAIRRNTDLYLITINCQSNRWEKERSTFMKVIASFKLN